MQSHRMTKQHLLSNADKKVHLFIPMSVQNGEYKLRVFFFAFSVFTSMTCEKSLDVLLGKIPTSDCSCPESILI